MSEYHKINSIYKRDRSTNKFILGDYSIPEFKALENVKWHATEKIDGTNIRIELSFYTAPEGIKCNMEFHGRTNNADIPKHLQAKLHELFDGIDWNSVFPDAKHEDKITIYGEGYGFKIQSGGNYCGNDVNFIMFDIKYNNYWLEWDSVVDISKKIHVNFVNDFGYMTLMEAIEFVKKGFVSPLAESHPNGNKQYIAEGLVLRAPCGLLRRNGERIIVKVKHKDFINI